jgi:hypothetical protein
MVHPVHIRRHDKCMARPLRIELADGLYHVTSRVAVISARIFFSARQTDLPWPLRMSPAIIPCRKSRRVSAFIMQMTPIHFSFILLLSSESRIEKNGHVVTPCPSHSWRNASMGLRLAARRAGK